MALIKCMECGKAISDKAENCIHCGCPNYKKQYLDNKLFSKLDYVNAFKLLLEIKGIKDYKKPTCSEADTNKYVKLWLQINCRRLSKDIDLDTISLVSDNPENDYEKFHSAINHEIELINVRLYGTDDKGVRQTRTITKCTDCGLIQPKSKYTDLCVGCFNDSFIDTKEVLALTRNEKKLLHQEVIKLVRIVNYVFNQVKPQEYIGCIEICDYLKEMYNIDDSIYDIIAVFNYLLTECEHANILNEIEGKPYLTKDYRRTKYYLANYTTEKVNDLETGYWECDENTKKEIENNTKVILESAIRSIAELKQYSRGNTLMMTACKLYDTDFDFTLTDMQEARSECIASYDTQKEVKIKIAQNRVEQEEIQKRIDERNRIAEILTQPVKNTDPNYVESATCPNCHKNSVYRISNVKRGASIGFFGLFSKDIGKTMECRSCGYKW